MQGLHARPADLLVRLANQFESKILIGKNGEVVDCKSMISLMTLGAEKGTELAASQQLRPPTLIILGDVVALRDRLAWFEHELHDSASRVRS